MARGIGRPMAALVLSDKERSYLERQARRRRVARSLSDRCRMILRCADGLTNKAVAIELGVHEHTVGKWRRRFLKERIDGLSDEPRPGRPRTLSDEKVAAVIERTLETTPADATHWSLRSMARESGLSHTTVRRIWAAFSVQPHRSETFKLSSDPLFVDKVRDIIGLYLSPPDRALVLCVDSISESYASPRHGGGEAGPVVGAGGEADEVERSGSDSGWRCRGGDAGSPSTYCGGCSPSAHADRPEPVPPSRAVECFVAHPERGGARWVARAAVGDQQGVLRDHRIEGSRG